MWSHFVAYLERRFKERMEGVWCSRSIVAKNQRPAMCVSLIRQTRRQVRVQTDNNIRVPYVPCWSEHSIVT